jgi:hypothetical protein
MYINSVDTILSNIIDKSYEVILKSKTFSSILKVSNFSSKYENIVKMINDFIKTIDWTPIKELFTDNKHSKTVIDIMQKYIAYYTFIAIGYFYEDKMDTYKNNVIEFSKLVNKSMIDIPGFLTSESNSNIFMVTDIVRNIREIVDDEKFKQRKKIDEKYYNALKDLEELGSDFVTSFLSLKANHNDKFTQCQNIIKTIILRRLYFSIDKNEILKLLETVDENTGETIYIDVSFPLEKSIDIAEIEATLTQEEIDQGLAKNIFEIITTGDQMYQQYFAQTVDSKIAELLDSGFIVPISEDFMLYHDDAEKYETQKIDIRKREQLKIRYILDKINSVETLNVKDPEAIKKSSGLSVVHANRVAMTMNEIENVKIINKLLSYGTKATEGMDSGNELISYTRYPYVNFKMFKRDGFPMIFDKTIDVIRSVSFDKFGATTQSKNNTIQMRIGSDGQLLNIVGFVIPTGLRSLGCLRIKDVTEIDGGYDAFIKAIDDDVNGRKITDRYWYFNLSNNVSQITTYEHFDEMEQSEQCKLICAKIRDDIINIVSQRITSVLSHFTELSFFAAFKIVTKIMEMTFKIPETDPKFSDIKKLIYYKLYQKYIPQYDIKDDNVFGISGETQHLPVVPEKDTKKILYINTKMIVEEKQQSDTRSGSSRDTISIDAICQHFVSWDNIITQKKVGVIKYTEALDEFAQQFVKVTDELDYVCKSCGATLDIKKYVTDGAYDSSTQKFVAFYIPMNVLLEDLPEYRKYNIAIRNMDRLIDQKLASILNIHFLEGHQTTQKIKRNSMIKDVIDLVLLVNSFMKKENMKERKDHVEKLYGINGDISNLFQFELDNSIFIFTSGDKDYYKFIKHNNIVAYIIFMILLELNENHISAITDRICNYALYEKFGERIMGDLKIRVDNTNGVKNITEFPLLSYTIYVITCILSKYAIWYVKDGEDTHKKVNPIKQKIMIHTIIDIINNVLECSDKYQGKRIFEVIKTKFYMKLTSVYSNKTFLESIRENSQLATKKINSGIDTNKSIVLEINSEYSPMLLDYHEFNKYVSARFIPSVVKYTETNIEITNLTHCKAGMSHIFALEPGNKRVKCTVCNLYLDEIKYDEAQTDYIKSAMELRQLEKIGDRYCLSGERHHFIRDIKNNIMQCIKCKYIAGDYLPSEKLKQLKKILFEPHVIKAIKISDKKKEKHDLYVSNVMKALRGTYIESKTHRDDYYKFIDNFIMTLQKDVGDVVNIDSDLVYLNDDMYIINHNHLGYPIQPPLMLSGHGPEISFKKNHSFFKCDVIMYESEKGGKISVFYDAHSYILLGYKESNKDFIRSSKSENRIKILYSVKNKLRYLGSTSKYINVAQNEDLKNLNDDELTALLSQERITHIGNIIHQLVICLNRIKNHTKVSTPSEDIDEMDVGQEFNIEKYSRKLQLLKLRDTDANTPKSNKKIFKLWNMVVQNLHYFEKHSKDVKIIHLGDYVDIEDIIDNDYAGNLILFYFVSELSKLLVINQNKYVKKTLVEFIIEFIIYSFNEYNLDYLASSNELRRFECMLMSSDYLSDLEKNGFGMDTFIEAFEEKTKEQLAEEEDDREAEDAIDMDGENEDDENANESYLERDSGRFNDDVQSLELELN